MKAFITDDFLLMSDAARELFHSHAKHLPVIDYHNHLDPAAIATNKKYDNIGALWVAADPYKHRAMRLAGVAEREISGTATHREKFDAWARTCPRTVGSPLFDWSALELKRLFGIDEVLCPQNAESIWQHCNALLAQDEYSTIGILQKWNTEVLCTSDDLMDNVDIHRQATGRAGSFSVLPSLRADSILNFGTDAATLDEYMHAICLRLDAFNEAGCRLADHALDNGFGFALPQAGEASALYLRRKQGNALTDAEEVRLRSYLLHELAKQYAARGWVMQLHIGAERFTSSRLRRLAGPAGGYATIGSACNIGSLCRFLDSVEAAGLLPKTIIYTLNPADNAAFSTLTGSFAADGDWVIQHGPAWWYNDHKEGMESHLRSLASYSLLSRFIGMTTDSRSILSFSRHEYFRRILCNYIGGMAHRGEAPHDMELLAEMVQDISYRNAKQWIF